VIGPTAAAAATALLRPTALPAVVPTPSRNTAATRLVIPSLGIDTPVAEVGWRLKQTAEAILGEWDTVAGAVGFLRGSADPGTVGNCVLAGHSMDSDGSGLSELYRIPIGDVLVLYNAAGSEYTYVVEGILTVDETGATVDEKRQHARLLDPTDQPVLTVVTCWPAWSYTSRVVVRARLRGANQ
jgi:sortase A